MDGWTKLLYARPSDLANIYYSLNMYIRLYYQKTSNIVTTGNIIDYNITSTTIIDYYIIFVLGGLRITINKDEI